MTETVLFVDDEDNILNSVIRTFADSHFIIRTAPDASKALDLVRNETIAVLVSDNMMPGMSGMELLELTKTISPNTVKVMMTAYTDLPTVIEAINRSEVFRFIVKPWDNQELVTIVEEGVTRYRLMESLRHENEAVLYALAETIELKDPYTKGHCERVARYALLIAEELNLPDSAKDDIRFGSWLHDCGKIGIPEQILNAPRKLSSDEITTIRLHPDWGAEVARKARMSPIIVNIIRYHHEHYQGGGYPDNLSGKEIPVEARIVAIADTYDALTSTRPYNESRSRETAMGILREQCGKDLDPELTGLFLNILEKQE
ncbi:MAG: HD domain-containing protein [Geobacteraceae bacterium]|nr:HD domain-containing protein [Geobacteraceae bacterium]